MFFRKTNCRWLVIGCVASVLLLAAVGFLLYKNQTEDTQGLLGGLELPGGGSVESAHEPSLKTEELVTGLSNIWDMVFVDNKTMIFNERSGDLRAVNIETKEDWLIVTVPNVRAEGEGGLLGLAADSQFATNRYLYACYNADGNRRAVRVTRFKIGEDNKSASEFTDIITDIQSQGGRHSGCRMQMDANGNLWIGTGDSAIGSAPQDPKSLAGKVLRVTRDGKGVEGNMAAPYDNRIYNIGHRNIQGIVLMKTPLSNGAVGLTAEHGPDNQDEINWLMPGNFGWDPEGTRGVYDESVPMTNKEKFPDAIESVWNTGNSTAAISGMTFLTGTRWSAWRGWLAVATLKGQHVRLLQINGDGSVKADKKVLTNFGRIRTAVEGPAGDLFIATDNGNNTDKIIRVIPE